MDMMCESVMGVRLGDRWNMDRDTELWPCAPGTWQWRLFGSPPIIARRELWAVLPSKYPDGPGVVHPYQMCHCIVHGKDGERPVWTWDGNRDMPTLSPSILVDTTWGEDNIRVFWHGYLRHGRFEACE